jgi:hypothetical protein
MPGTDSSLLQSGPARKDRKNNASHVAGEVSCIVVKRLRILKMLVDVKFLDAGRHDCAADSPRVAPRKRNGIGKPHMRLPRNKCRRDKPGQEIIHSVTRTRRCSQTRLV